MSRFTVDVKAFKVFEIEADTPEEAQEIADGRAEMEGWAVDGESDVEEDDGQDEQDYAQAMLGADMDNS